MSRKGNCIDNGATEQVFGHIKDEFFRNQEFPIFETFKAELEKYIVHWNTRRRQVSLKGLTPERNSESVPICSLAAFYFVLSKNWGAVHLPGPLCVAGGASRRDVGRCKLLCNLCSAVGALLVCERFWGMW